MYVWLNVATVCSIYILRETGIGGEAVMEKMLGREE